MGVTLTDIDLDWADFEAAGRESRRHLRELAEDTEQLRALLLAALRDPDQLDAGAGGEPADRLALRELPNGSRLELHVSAATQIGEVHRARSPFSCLILRGGHQNTWYEDEPGEHVPLVTRFDQPGSCYSISADTVISIDPVEDTVALVVRGPGAVAIADRPEDAEAEGAERLRQVAARIARLGVLGEGEGAPA